GRAGPAVDGAGIRQSAVENVFWHRTMPNARRLWPARGQAGPWSIARLAGVRVHAANRHQRRTRSCLGHETYRPAAGQFPCVSTNVAGTRGTRATGSVQPLAGAPNAFPAGSRNAPGQRPGGGWVTGSADWG